MLEERGVLVDGNLADRTFSVSKKRSTHDSEEVLVQMSTTNLHNYAHALMYSVSNPVSVNNLW